MAYSGGYYFLTEPLILEGIHAHTASLPQPFSDTHLAAVNATQETPWAINRFVLGVLMEAWEIDRALPGMPVAYDAALPDRIPDATWEAMDRAERAAHKARMSDIHTENAKAAAARISFLDRVAYARELEARPSLWFPHSLDFRGRLYPMTNAGPNPQGDDLSRALLHFAEGVPLGPDGLFWLMVRAANTWGNDKASHEERVAWTTEHLPEIIASADDPLAPGAFWLDAEEPLSFLATCHEIALAVDSGDPEGFMSHLPIPQDGSCNGLQHLSAMGLDPVGALATNLTASPVRHDIYETVAEHLRALVEEDASRGKSEAIGWVNNITRKTVKRAVMTTPYGVTSRGIRDQLLVDGHVAAVAKEKRLRGAAADYLRDRLVDSLGATIQAAREIMGYLQAVAATLAKAEMPFTWVTPTGSTIQQEYRALTMRRVSTLGGTLALMVEDEGGSRLDPRKSSLAAAPNFIHSFDAAHLALTINDCRSAGITSFAAIHDSLGVHAARTTEMNRTLRDRFVDIYRTDWLAEVEAFSKARLPEGKFPDRPVRGSFNLEEVRHARYFFA